MKLAFRLLVVDDQPDAAESAIRVLEEHLQDKGFDLHRTLPPDLSAEALQDFVRSQGQGRPYDLVMVDFDLQQPHDTGAVAAARLRSALQYTDMIFYSSNPEANLHQLLVDQEVQGVFVASRPELDSALVGLADTIIGKVVDITHMRGLAMAEVADMDVIMERTLADAFTSRSLPPDVVNNTVETLRRSLESMLGKIPPDLDAHGLSVLVSHGPTFTLTHKYRTIRRVAKKLSNKPLRDLQTLSSFENEVIKKRNILAHAEDQSVAPNGSAILRSSGEEGNVTVDNDWMIRFRDALRKNRSALDSVCRAICDEFVPAHPTDDPGKDQS